MATVSTHGDLTRLTVEPLSPIIGAQVTGARRHREQFVDAVFETEHPRPAPGQGRTTET